MDAIVTDGRKNLLARLDRYLSIYSEESIPVQRIAAFVESEPHCFMRSHVPGHITGSAWVTDREGKHVLLTHHKKLNKWLQLGGHADGEPNILSVALREAQEESGLKSIKIFSENIFDVDVHLIPGHNEEAEHFHYDIRFAFSAMKSELLKTSRESLELAWVSIDGIEDYTNEKSILRMRDKWKRHSI